MMATFCEHGYSFSSSTRCASDGCKIDFDPEPERDPLTDSELRAIEEMIHELTEGWHCKHQPGELRLVQFKDISQGQFIVNKSNGMALWEARWGSGPASEALALLPWAARCLFYELKRLKKSHEETEDNSYGDDP